MPIIPSRQQLRKQIRQQRRSLSEETQKAHAEALKLLLVQLLKKLDIKQAKISTYLTNDGEISLDPFINFCWQHYGLQFSFDVLLPIIDPMKNNFLKFLSYTDEQRLITNRFGIKEPVYDESLCYTAKEIDLILMPLVSFDREGNRLGMGGGFYDRTLEFIGNNVEAKHKPVLIGVAHHMQEQKKIPFESWDIPMDYIVTNHEIFFLD